MFPFSAVHCFRAKWGKKHDCLIFNMRACMHGGKFFRRNSLSGKQHLGTESESYYTDKPVMRCWRFYKEIS
jgi:hypothetical protein